RRPRSLYVRSLFHGAIRYTNLLRLAKYRSVSAPGLAPFSSPAHRFGTRSSPSVQLCQPSHPPKILHANEEFFLVGTIEERAGQFVRRLSRRLQGARILLGLRKTIRRSLRPFG